MFLTCFELLRPCVQTLSLEKTASCSSLRNTASNDRKYVITVSFANRFAFNTICYSIQSTITKLSWVEIVWLLWVIRILRNWFNWNDYKSRNKLLPYTFLRNFV